MQMTVGPQVHKVANYETDSDNTDFDKGDL